MMTLEELEETNGGKRRITYPVNTGLEPYYYGESESEDDFYDLYYKNATSNEQKLLGPAVDPEPREGES